MALMYFLTKSDFDRVQREVETVLITNDDISILNDAQLAARTEIESYLRDRYDLTELFPTFPDHDKVLEYETGDIVVIPNGDFIKAIAAVPANTNHNDDDFWETVEPRDPLIVEFMVDLTLYRIHSRLAPNQIPEHRIQRRDDAIAFLKKVAKFEINTGWTPADAENGNSAISWGSNTKESKTY